MTKLNKVHLKFYKQRLRTLNVCFITFQSLYTALSVIVKIPGETVEFDLLLVVILLR